MALLRLAVFDMAGTTVRDLKEVETCFADTARQVGLDISDEEIQAAQGWTKRVVFEKYWERQIGSRSEAWQKEVDASYDLFCHNLEQHYLTQGAQPTDGGLEVLSFLREKGVRTALATGFYRKVTDIILDKLGWLEGLDEHHQNQGASPVDLSLCTEDVQQGKPAPDMILKAMEVFGVTDLSEVLMIGDTPADIESGKRAGCLSLGVANGSHRREQLEACEPDAVLADMHELISYLQGRGTDFPA